MKYDFIDPEVERWHRTYSRFPGVATCVELLGSRKVHGAWVDIIESELLAHAHELSDELISAARACQNDWVRSLLINVIAESRLPQAISFFVERINSKTEMERNGAIEGLTKLDTKESRRALWEAGVKYK